VYSCPCNLHEFTKIYLKTKWNFRMLRLHLLQQPKQDLQTIFPAIYQS
jgi:hypothetical protein